VLLVSLVAMICCGSLLYFGRGSASPARVANNVGNNVSVAQDNALGASAGSASGTSGGTPWCTSAESSCTDSVAINGQPEYIQFTATGGTRIYTYQLQGTVPSFVTPNWPAHEITIEPEDCTQDPGTYKVVLVVTDSAGNTGVLNFTLSVSTGSACPG
jgi:hypothetical protein